MCPALFIKKLNQKSKKKNSNGLVFLVDGFHHPCHRKGRIQGKLRPWRIIRWNISQCHCLFRLFLHRPRPVDWNSPWRQNTNFRKCYSVFHRFRQAKFTDCGSILNSSQFLLLPQLTQKTKLNLKTVKFDSKIIISLSKILIRETHCM